MSLTLFALATSRKACAGLMESLLLPATVNTLSIYMQSSAWALPLKKPTHEENDVSAHNISADVRPWERRLLRAC